MYTVYLFSKNCQPIILLIFNMLQLQKKIGMVTVNHNSKASKLIDDYIAKSPAFAQKICNMLRQIILKADPKIIEDWKWGPNYYKDGMICGYGTFKGWVTFSFFQGALMKDPKKLFNYGDANAHNRSIKFT